MPTTFVTKSGDHTFPNVSTITDILVTGGDISGCRIELRNDAAPAPTASGQIDYDTTSDLIVYGDGSATRTVVELTATQALTNKTVNGLTITTTTGTLTIAAGKTLTVSNTLTFAGTDGSTLNVGTGGTLGTAAYKNIGTSGTTVPLLDNANTWSAAQTFSPDTNSSAIISSACSLTGSDATVFWNYSGTWNTTGAPTAFKINITNTASDAASLLADWQVGSISRFKVAIDGAATVNRNAAAAPTPPASTVLHLSQADQTNNRVVLDVFSPANHSGAFIVRRARGTADSPSAVQDGDNIGSLAAFGYGATGYHSGGAASVRFTAVGNWTDSARGCCISFFTCETGTTSNTERVRIDDGGELISYYGRIRALRVHTAAGDVTVATTDDIVVVNKDTGAATAVNLPASPETGRVYTIKDGKGDAAANNITVTPAAGNIDGAATYVMNANYQTACFAYNGTQWNVIST